MKLAAQFKRSQFCFKFNCIIACKFWRNHQYGRFKFIYANIQVADTSLIAAHIKVKKDNGTNFR
ncbi:hypothetical protein SAMN05216469_12527 [Ruminococcus albus]|uniref:Uncharacterized protein n=1 Tax=Ruminococcus albus TaxID=1264 RepID=A0A1H7PUP7_RUMAL|nr:hypothetical protein SAMN05216469_12527 [Ruminococcus albus]